VIREIPWFLDGMPAYIFAYMHPQTSSTSCECNEESLTPEMDPTPSLVPPLQLNRGPARCAEYTEHTDDRWQESLKNTWDDEIKPLLKHAESTFKKFIKEIKGTPEFKKIKTKFDKAEQAFRAFRKNIVQDIKNHLKQKNTGQSNDEAA
jgi:hypothetical protein